jgi:hypothetical protein
MASRNSKRQTYARYQERRKDADLNDLVGYIKGLGIRPNRLDWKKFQNIAREYSIDVTEADFEYVKDLLS